MKILVSIGDEYTSVYHAAVSSNNEAVTLICQGASADQKLTVDGDELNGNVRITLDDGEGNPNIIGQTFDIPDYLPYVVIHHHAYDGVEFDVVGSAKTKELAGIVKRTAVSAFKESSVHITEDFDDALQSCFDTGYEWNVFTILDFSKEAAEKEAA